MPLSIHTKTNALKAAAPVDFDNSSASTHCDYRRNTHVEQSQEEFADDAELKELIRAEMIKAIDTSKKVEEGKKICSRIAEEGFDSDDEEEDPRIPKEEFIALMKGLRKALKTIKFGRRYKMRSNIALTEVVADIEAIKSGNFKLID